MTKSSDACVTCLLHARIKDYADAICSHRVSHHLAHLGQLPYVGLDIWGLNARQGQTAIEIRKHREDRTTEAVYLVFKTLDYGLQPNRHVEHVKNALCWGDAFIVQVEEERDGKGRPVYVNLPDDFSKNPLAKILLEGAAPKMGWSLRV